MYENVVSVTVRMAGSKYVLWHCVRRDIPVWGKALAVELQNKPVTPNLICSRRLAQTAAARAAPTPHLY